MDKCKGLSYLYSSHDLRPISTPRSHLSLDFDEGEGPRWRFRKVSMALKNHLFKVRGDVVARGWCTKAYRGGTVLGGSVAALRGSIAALSEWG
ncbi:putative serine/threonine-protein kinase gdt4 [Gossypium arboreum]|uniref:Putative serine/threonine-protein kinase gdt4 n=1 Tax=Gossypium arboreum TaxID=29729 RepID=A0A0B0N5C6_GOSAR|nr:putative serine/threonine-protein kinase gdt4 [Gossypium arboreum]